MLDTIREESLRLGGLREAWLEIQKTRPTIRQRDAAELLGVSEGELLASRLGRDVVAIRPEWPALLRELAVLGPVKTITRNTQAVHETVGHYDNLSFVGPIGLVQSRGLDLRLLLDRWAAGFVVREAARGSARTSLQFFDAHGEAVHKVYPEDESGMAALFGLAARYATAQVPAFRTAATASQPISANDLPAERRQALLSDWSALRDTHDFGTMLERHGIARPVALEVARDTFTKRVSPSDLAPFFDLVATSGVPVMVFVGNRGAVQIRTAPVTKVQRIGPWLNILESDFNLHLQEQGIASLWVVEKPTIDGTVTSVEAYAEGGSEVVVFYGARKPGKPELEGWRELAANLRTGNLP